MDLARGVYAHPQRSIQPTPRAGAARSQVRRRIEAASGHSWPGRTGRSGTSVAQACDRRRPGGPCPGLIPRVGVGFDRRAKHLGPRQPHCRVERVDALQQFAQPVVASPGCHHRPTLAELEDDAAVAWPHRAQLRHVPAPTTEKSLEYELAVARQGDLQIHPIQAQDQDPCDPDHDEPRWFAPGRRIPCGKATPAKTTRHHSPNATMPPRER
jgi:hypothetical protein